MKTKNASSSAPFAYEGLDRVIHERARLSVLTSLITHPSGFDLCRAEAVLWPNRWQSRPPIFKCSKRMEWSVSLKRRRAAAHKPSPASPPTVGRVT